MEIAEIKEKLTLKAVLDHYGLKPDKHLRLHCPFHDDRTPSLQVYYKTHTCYCFSTNCPTHGKAMDVVDFLMYKEHCSKHEAILKAKAMVQGEAPSPKPTSSRSKSDILTRMFTYFKNAVHNSNPAKAYLKGRGLDHEKTEVGHNTGQFHHGARKDKMLIAECLQVGLLQDKGIVARTGEKGYKPFAKGCICFALKDAKGRVTGLYFRSITDDKDQRHFYLKDRQGLYPGYPDKHTKKLVLTESVIDAASLLQQEHITEHFTILALYGTNGLTEEHKGAIKGLRGLEEVVFFLNGDEAGRKATEKHSTTIKELHPDVTLSTVDVPEGEDVNSLLVGHDPEILPHLLGERSFLFSNETSSTEPSNETSNERKEAFGPKQKAPDTENEKKELDTTDPHALRYTTEVAAYTVMGGIKGGADAMKVTLKVTAGNKKRRAKVDLFEDEQVERFCKKASQRLDLPREGLEEDVQYLTDLLEEHRNEKMRKRKEEEQPVTPLTTKEREELETFAKKSDLVQRIEDLLGKAGIVGEERTRTFLFLIALSYKLPETLHALIQGSSGSGKTRLLQQVAACMPPERVTKLTRVSEKAFYNYPEDHFKNRLLCLEDMDGLGEEAEFAFRELQSNGELTSSVSVKHEDGKISQAEKKVKGPVASLACTTNGEIYEDNMSRCFLVAVNEQEEQTRAIVHYQNERAAGRIDKGQEENTKAFLQKFTRMLRPFEVTNPYAGRITLPREAHKIRRLNELFQGFTRVVTVLHQYQRKKDDKGRLIATKEDIGTATDLMLEAILLKVDELDGSLRGFFEQIKSYVEKKAKEQGERPSDTHFTRFEVREATGVGKTRQHELIRKLVELEYLCQSGHANRGFKYKISHWDDHAALKKRIKDHLHEQLRNMDDERSPSMNTSVAEEGPYQ